jgi:hypothetical protein
MMMKPVFTSMFTNQNLLARMAFHLSFTRIPQVAKTLRVGESVSTVVFAAN